MLFITTMRLIADAYLQYPNFLKYKTYTYRVVMICELSLSIIVILGCVHSKIKEQLKYINILMTIMSVKMVLGFLIMNQNEDDSVSDLTGT